MQNPAEGGGSGDGRENERSYFRVQARILVRYRPLAAGEFDTIRREIETVRQDPEGLDAVMVGWMRGLEAKLDLILSHLDPSVPAPLGPRDLTDVEISGSGMRWATKESVEVGSDLLIELQLPGLVTRRVRAIARVIRCIEPRGEQSDRHVAVSFRVIDEDDRQAIVRFANDVQRVFLRSRAEAGRS